jgi:protein-disulfide isomerase
MTSRWGGRTSTVSSPRAQQLGLDPAKFDGCLDSDAHAELVTANYQLGQQAGVNGTPTVFIDGRQSLSPNDWDVLKAEIQRALGQ